ncbi:MAG: hypothetical protein IVW54_05995 [Candidatus Binataceae bacterium]|nr:hypothetical protein [Candidatus Binataceae bacterium]
MTIVEALRQDPELLPEWLDGYTRGDRFNRRAFFSSRVVYYPGSGDDGHAVKLFGSAHAAHVFVYADFGYAKSEIMQRLDPAGPGHFQGYHPVGTMAVTQASLGAQGWSAHDLRETRAHNQYPLVSLSFGLVAVLDRDSERDDNHGPSRLAIMFLKWDGFAAYDALFCQSQGTTSPYGVLLQDHGFGGNYDWFGAGGLLEGIARKGETLPTWLVAGENTEPWEGYQRLPGVLGEPGGMHNTTRFLYRDVATKKNAGRSA